MAEILSGALQPHHQPVAVSILDPKGRTDDEIDKWVREFFVKWEGTHAVSAPTYVMESGNERIYMQAVDRFRWHRQNEEAGIAQARMQFAGFQEGEALKTGRVALATASDLRAQVKPVGGLSTRGGFGR